MRTEMLSIAAVLFAGLTAVAVAQQSYDLKVVDDLKEGYFQRTYKGKRFSDSGTITRYQKGFISSYWYVEIADPPDAWRRVYCFIATSENDPRLKAMQKEFPENTKVRMTGVMSEWHTNDNTLRLEDFCEIKR